MDSELKAVAATLADLASLPNYRPTRRKKEDRGLHRSHVDGSRERRNTFWVNTMKLSEIIRRVIDLSTIVKHETEMRQEDVDTLL